MLEIFNMALQNIRRRALRNLLTITGLAIFVLIFILISSVTLTMQNSISESLSDLGGEIMIWDKGAFVPFLGSGIPENYTNRIEKIQYVKNVAPEITGFPSTVDSEEWRVTIGINPSDIPFLYTYTMLEGAMISNDENKAVIGYLFADFIKKHVGDNVTIVYSANRQTLPVVGIYKTDTWMDNVVIVPFKTAQNIFGLAGRTSIITVTVTDPSKIEFVINEIRKEIPDVNVFKSQEATARLAPIMNSITWFSYVLFLIAGAACFLGISNVILTGVLERAKEIGILKALGAKGGDVTRMIIYESAVLGAFGGLTGCLISLGLLIQGVLVPITSTSAMRISVFPEVFIYGLILSVVISILATLYPVWRAIRLRPNEVLKFG
jgi:putative ABC transport system permease protein